MCDILRPDLFFSIRSNHGDDAQHDVADLKYD